MQFFPLRFVQLDKPKKTCCPAKVDVWKGPDQSFVPTHGQKLPDKLLCAECATLLRARRASSAPIATCSGDASSAFVEAPKSRQLYVTYTTRGRRQGQTDRATAYARFPHT